MLHYYYFLLMLSYVPLLFYLADGYYEKNLKKGVLFIVSFLILMGVTSLCVKSMTIYIAIVFPLLFVLFLYLTRTNK